MPPSNPTTSDARGDAPAQAAPGFAAQASRLVEAARANERAVRDLEEAAQLLASGMDDLVHAEGLAQALAGLSAQVGRVRAAADEVRGVLEAAEGLGEVRAAAEEATGHVHAIEERLSSVADRALKLDERLAQADGRLAQALDRIDQAGLGAALERIETLEAKVDRVLETLSYQADSFVERVGPQVERLEKVAERMDAPAVADELADVLATNHQLFEAIDAMRNENADAQAYWDEVIEGWHGRHGRTGR